MTKNTIENSLKNSLEDEILVLLSSLEKKDNRGDKRIDWDKATIAISAFIENRDEQKQELLTQINGDIGKKLLNIAILINNIQLTAILFKNPNIAIYIENNDSSFFSDEPYKFILSYLKKTNLTIQESSFIQQSLLLLLDHPKINWEYKDIFGETILNLCVKLNHTDFVITILKKEGINVNTVDDRGGSPYYYATLNNNFEIIDALKKIDGFDHEIIEKNIGELFINNFTDEKIYNLIQNITKEKRIESEVINFQNQYGFTVLHKAIICKEKIETIKKLLAWSGIDFNITDNKGNKPLDHIIDQFCNIDNTWSSFIDHFSSDSYVKYFSNVIKLFIYREDYELNHITPNGNTLLHLCVDRNLTDIIDEIAKFPNIDPNIGDNNGATALFYAKLDNKTEIINKILQIKNVEVNIIKGHEQELFCSLYKKEKKLDFILQNARAEKINNLYKLKNKDNVLLIKLIIDKKKFFDKYNCKLLQKIIDYSDVFISEVNQDNELLQLVIDKYYKKIYLSECVNKNKYTEYKKALLSIIELLINHNDSLDIDVQNLPEIEELIVHRKIELIQENLKWISSDETDINIEVENIGKDSDDEADL